MTTIKGKSMTTPRGTDMLELPFSLKGRLKKARRDAMPLERLFLPFSSADGRWGVGPAGIYLRALWKRSMLGDYRPGVGFWASAVVG